MQPFRFRLSELTSHARHIALAVVAALILLSGCTPRLSPLYRDYSIDKPPANDEPINTRIADALEEGGWTVVDGVTANVVATNSRKFNSWIVYSIEVELEVAPVGDGYVRVFIHPYRHYFTGARGKLPYLRKGLAREIMKTIEEPFETQGLQFAGTAQSRDKAYREGEG